MARSSEKKQKRKYKLKRRAKVLFAMLIMGYLLFIMVEQELEIHKQEQAMEDLKAQITHVEEKNEMIRRQIRYTQTESYIEEAARSKLGWVKDGEIIYIENNE